MEREHQSQDSILATLYSPRLERFLEFSSFWLNGAVITRSAHYIINANYFAEKFSGTTDDSYRILGIGFMSTVLLLSSKHLWRGLHKEMTPKEILGKVGLAGFGVAGGIMGNLRD